MIKKRWWELVASSTDDIVIWGRKIFVLVSAFLSVGVRLWAVAR